MNYSWHAEIVHVLNVGEETKMKLSIETDARLIFFSSRNDDSRCFYVFWDIQELE